MEKNNLTHILFVLVILAAIVLPLVSATLATTTMTWVVGSNKSFTVIYGGACSGTNFFFVESDANALLGDADSDGNATLVRPNSSSAGGATTLCQSATLAPITVQNNGNVDLNVDGNFVTDFNTIDVNIVLRVWQGTGSGCGSTFPAAYKAGTDANGFGGYNFPDCPIKYGGTDANGDPTTATGCKTFNQLQDKEDTRLVFKLLAGDLNQLCFSGDLNGYGASGGSVRSGNHPLQFQLGDGNTI